MPQSRARITIQEAPAVESVAARLRPPRLRVPRPTASALRGWAGCAFHRGFNGTRMRGEDADRIRSAEEYRGLAGMERYCREEYSRSGLDSVWCVYAFLWVRQSEGSRLISSISKGTRLHAQAIGPAIKTFWERGVLDFIPKVLPEESRNVHRTIFRNIFRRIWDVSTPRQRPWV